MVNRVNKIKVKIPIIIQKKNKNWKQNIESYKKNNIIF